MNFGEPTKNDLLDHMKMLANGIELFFEKGDEISVQIFSECIKEAFEDSNQFH